MEQRRLTKHGRTETKKDAYPQIYQNNPQLAVEKLLPGIKLVAPNFVAGDRFATGSMIASVMRITGLYREANSDDIANILIYFGTSSEFRNKNCFFNMESFIKNIAKKNTGGEK